MQFVTKAVTEGGNKMNKIMRTSCPRDCFGGCTMKLYIEDGRVVKLEGDGIDRATGGKLCSKGLSYVDYIYSQNRVGYPLVRIGERGEGKFKKGVVNIYEGLPESSGASVNKLTSQETSDIGYGATYYDCYVEVKKCQP